MAKVKGFSAKLVHAELAETVELRLERNTLEEIVTAQRLIIMELTENEDRLHKLIDIERRKTHNAELALQGDALDDTSILKEESPF